MNFLQGRSTRFRIALTICKLIVWTMSEVKPKFQDELKAYEARKGELLDIADGKFAVFKGSEFLGVFDTPAAAYDAGVSKYGNVPFLVKHVRKEERVEHAPVLFWGISHACP